MATTTAALLGRGQLNVVIAGATGRLGQYVTKAFLSPGFRPHFSRVIALVRDASSITSTEFIRLGAEVKGVSFDDLDELTKASAGADVVINVLGGQVPLEVRNRVAEAAVKAGASVYFPSEFGVDHRLNDFADFESPEWLKKRGHVEFVKSISGGKLKIISVHNGWFLEASIVIPVSLESFYSSNRDDPGPWFGFDIPGKTITCIGPSSVRITFTSLSDIARALAQLSILASAPSQDIQDTVPEHVRIGGSFYSYDDIARVLKGLGKEVRVVSEDLKEAREKLREGVLNGSVQHPLTHIRILAGEGRTDFSASNENELVNPKQSLWKWKTVEDQLKEKFA